MGDLTELKLKHLDRLLFPSRKSIILERYRGCELVYLLWMVADTDIAKINKCSENPELYFVLDITEFERPIIT